MEIKITMDPHNRFPTVDKMDIYASFGYLPNWIETAEINGQTMRESLKENYCAPTIEIDGGELTKDGVYKYPGDPDLYAHGKWELNGEICYIFKYAIVGIINKDGTTFVTRMN